MIGLNQVFLNSNKVQLLSSKSIATNSTAREANVQNNSPQQPINNVSSIDLRNALISQNRIAFKGNNDYEQYLTDSDKSLISRHMDELSRITPEERESAHKLFEKEKAVLKEKVLHAKDEIIEAKIKKLISNAHDVKHEHKAYIITGCSSAGKSTIVEDLIENTNSLLIDQDVAKANLPIEHPISSKVKQYGSALIGSKGSELLNEIIDEESKKGTNICCPTGCNKSDLTNIIDKLSNNGYEIELINVKIDAETAAKRLMGRINSGRFTRIEKVMQELNASETLINEELKNHKDSIKNYTVVDNSPNKPAKAIMVSSVGDGIEPEKGKGGILERTSIVKITPQEEIEKIKLANM